MQIYDDGQWVSSVPCDLLASSRNETMWFGINAERNAVWNGRIDELALFDKALSDDEVAELYQTAVDELARTE